MDKICFVSIDIEPDYGKKGVSGIENLDKILLIFQKYGVSATFFITGEILEKYPEKFRQLSKNYEIACHGGMSHRFWDKLSENERWSELSSFQRIYQEIFDRKPAGFRAPSHLIDKDAIALLIKVGFKYDASIVPHYPFFTRYRGYQGKAPKEPYYPNPANIRQKLAEVRPPLLLEIPCTGLLMGVPLAGTWIRKLPLIVYYFLLAIKKPKFLTLSLHSWDSLSPQTLNKLEAILAILAKDYQFKKAEQIRN